MRHSLRRDGYVADPEAGHIVSAGPQFAAGSLAGPKDVSAIREQLGRIQRAISDDPALAVGSAKDLIESTAEVVLAERGLPISDKADLPEVLRQAQQELGLHPGSAAPGPDSTDAVKRILGGVSTIAAGLAELRNRGYGTGHGPAGARVGLRPGHAHLAVNAAFTWCQLMLDTLADREHPGAAPSAANNLSCGPNAAAPDSPVAARRKGHAFAS